MPTPSLPDALVPVRIWIEANLPGAVPVEIVLLLPTGQRMPLTLPGPTAFASRPPADLPAQSPEAVVVDVPARGMSPTEESIVRYLAGKGWQTGQQIADGIGYRRNHTFTTILANLAETGLVESSTRHGYRLAPASTETEPES